MLRQLLEQMFSIVVQTFLMREGSSIPYSRSARMQWDAIPANGGLEARLKLKGARLKRHPPDVCDHKM